MCFALMWPFIILASNAATAPVLEQLDPPRRAAVVMALLALVLTGLVLVMCVLLGGHWVRRLARHKPGAPFSNTRTTSEPENRRLRKSLNSLLPTENSGETLHLDSSTKETRADP
jgi:hypothetical protein